MSEQMYEKMMKIDGPNMEFVIGRGIEAQDRDGLSKTISQEAFDTLMQQIRVWIGTRVMRYDDQSGVMPQTVTVNISVDVEA